MLKRSKKYSRINDHRYAFISYGDEKGGQCDFSKRQLFIHCYRNLKIDNF